MGLNMDSVKGTADDFAFSLAATKASKEMALTTLQHGEPAPQCPGFATLGKE